MSKLLEIILVFNILYNPVCFCVELKYVPTNLDYYQTDYCTAKLACTHGGQLYNTSLCGCRPLRSVEEVFYDYRYMREEITRIHNAGRNLIASGKLFHAASGKFFPPAADMMVMSYNLELEYGARCYAMRWTEPNMHDNCRGDTAGPLNGQNTHSAGQPFWTMEAMAGVWFMEYRDYSPNDIPKFDIWPDRNDTGHFTQFVWAQNYEIGCGRAWNNEHSLTGTYYENCNYHSLYLMGNVRQSPVYTEGPPCSKCPFNLTCGKDYPYLCGDSRPIVYPEDIKNTLKIRSIASIILPTFLCISLNFIVISFS